MNSLLYILPFVLLWTFSFIYNAQSELPKQICSSHKKLSDSLHFSQILHNKQADWYTRKADRYRAKYLLISPNTNLLTSEIPNIVKQAIPGNTKDYETIVALYTIDEVQKYIEKRTNLPEDQKQLCLYFFGFSKMNYLAFRERHAEEINVKSSKSSFKRTLHYLQDLIRRRKNNPPLIPLATANKAR